MRTWYCQSFRSPVGCGPVARHRRSTAIRLSPARVRSSDIGKSLSGSSVALREPTNQPQRFFSLVLRYRRIHVGVERVRGEGSLREPSGFLEDGLGSRVRPAHFWTSLRRCRSRMSSASLGRPPIRLVRMRSSSEGMKIFAVPISTDTRRDQRSSNTTSAPSTVVRVAETRTSTCSSFSRTYRPFRRASFGERLGSKSKGRAAVLSFSISSECTQKS